MARRAKAKIAEAQLKNWKLLEQFQEHLEPHMNQGSTSLTVDRELGESTYLSMVLFSMFNPVLESARSLCAASRFERVQEELCGQPVKLTSFSEMQHICEPELLAGLLRELGAQALPKFGDPNLRAKIGDLIANDGTLLPALPRMAWALWQNPKNRAGKLHLEFSVFRQVPVEFTVTAGNVSERLIWKQKLRKGAFYVNDREFSHDHGLIKTVQKAGSSFVLRLHNNTIITPLETPLEISEKARQAGVKSDLKVRLGGQADGPIGRLVRVEANGHVFLLFTDRSDLEAELVALIYLYRWQIELFFKWIKCILGCRHWLAESQQGMTLQVYCALIASVLLVLWTGRKPTLRQWEALQLYWMGWVSVEELERVLQPRKI